MDVLVRGGNFRNKGDEGMTLTVQRELSARIPDVNFWLWGHAGQAEYAYAHGINPCFKEAGLFKAACFLVRALARRGDVRAMFRRDRTAAYVLAHLPGLDAVIDISGFGYSDVWGYMATRAGACWAEACREWGAPYLCLPQAWGPFTQPLVRRYVERLCVSAAYVCARDAVSLQNLSELVGHRGVRVEQAPDLAFLFKGGNRAAGGQLLKGLGIELSGAPLVAITPNMRIYERTRGRGIDNEYLKFLKHLASHCIQEWNATVLLIPHEIQLGNGTCRDDRYLCGLLDIMVANERQCFRIKEACLAETVRSLYPHIDLLIGSRFHSLVYALSSGVPVVAVSWAHKYRELLRRFDLDSYLIDFEKMDPEPARTVLNRAWSSREKSRERIRTVMIGIERELSLLFDDVAQRLVAGRDGRAAPGSC